MTVLRRYTILVASIIFLTLFPSLTWSAGRLEIGQTCENNGRCKTDQETVHPLSTILSTDELKQIQSKPVTKITIPGIQFSEPTADKGPDGNTYIYIPYLGEYISAVYRYALVIMGIVAVLMIIVSGLTITMSGGDTGKIQQAKERIGKAIIGLLLGVGSYTILYTINPSLVTFKNLRILFIPGIPAEVSYEEGGPDSSVDKTLKRGFIGGNPTPKGNEKCLYDNYTPGINIGQKPEVEIINFLGIRAIPFNKRAIEQLKLVERDILASEDPEVVGYLQYMRDVRAKKVPDLLGEKDGAGVISNSLGKGIGVSRRNGKQLKKLTYDMHVMGLSLDIMTRSNWDINWGGTKKGDPAKKYCEIYKNVVKKMKNGDYGEELKDDPYNMYERLDKKITSCLNAFANGTDPWTSLPQGMIDAFENHGFYWGGYGWGNKMRSDAMHFEYIGDCKS